MLRISDPTLRYVAKLNQPKYGTNAHPATASTWPQTYVKYPVTPVNSAISTVASIGRLNLKKSGIQIRFSAS